MRDARAQTRQPLHVNAQWLRVVLVRPSHPGNIGGSARAMKTMGLSELCLVKPKRFPDHEASARAAGAEDVLDACVVCDSLAQAVADCRLVIGTTARRRAIEWPALAPSQAAERLVSQRHTGAAALVFGPERNGLTNRELAMCHYTVCIPTQSAYSSLNLACAVQIMAYEVARIMASAMPSELVGAKAQPATQADLERLYAHLETTLEALDFVKTSPPTKLMQKLIRLFNRARPTDEEVRILRGILTAVERRTRNNT